MKKMHFLLLLLVSICLYNCRPVAMTGRQQLRLSSEKRYIKEAAGLYAQIRANNPISEDMEQSKMVQDVTTDLVKAVNRYYEQNHLTAQIKRFQWQVTLFDSPEINAFCLPGGKISVMTGILPIAQNRDGLAAIIGHEIAHALAGHGLERKSIGNLLTVGAITTDVVLASQGKTVDTRQNAQNVYTLGAILGAQLPYSRLHEHEADEMGLYLMAMAGYDPTEAPHVWERMIELNGKSNGGFFSTHPKDSKRKQRLESLCPKAREYARLYGPPSAPDATPTPTEPVPTEPIATAERRQAPQNPSPVAVKTGAETTMAGFQSASAAPKAAPQDYFRLQVAYVNSFNLSKYKKKGNSFQIEKAKGSADMWIVWHEESFEDKAEAASTLSQIKEQGFKDACVIEFRKGKIFGKVE